MSGDIGDFRSLLAKVGNGQPLGIDEAERAFDIMTSGDATPAQMGAFLMGLKVRGETAQELAGGARMLDAIVTLHVSLLAEVPDTLIARKAGQAAAEAVSEAAREVRAGRRSLADFDAMLRADGNVLNPGTTADLVCATLFANEL